jgi:hypothetical protein
VEELREAFAALSVRVSRKEITALAASYAHDAAAADESRKKKTEKDKEKDEKETKPRVPYAKLLWLLGVGAQQNGEAEAAEAAATVAEILAGGGGKGGKKGLPPGKRPWPRWRGKRGAVKQSGNDGEVCVVICCF